MAESLPLHPGRCFLLPPCAPCDPTWLVVRVPVLSEQMMEVQPSVSTEGSVRTMACRLAILRVPVWVPRKTAAGKEACQSVP